MEAERERSVAETAGDVEAEVRRRYGAGAREAEADLCCATEYEARYLEILPAEIIEKDYGCGDPSRHVGQGETVVDLGSGAGKICYILSQKVGPDGRVIGVDFNDAMLEVARRHQLEMAARIGHANVRFVKGKIQDLALDLGRVAAWLEKNPVTTVEDVERFEAECDRLRREAPLIAGDSVDVVVSNCVLNLVRPEDKSRLFDEIYRVLRRGGRAVISDIVSDEDSTPETRADPELWSGCIAGAFREDIFLEMFERAGFHGVEILERQQEPWRVIDGVEYRSMTVRAFKGKEGPCWEHGQAVLYRGPWRSVTDDDGHTYLRGKRIAVCKKTFDLLTDPAGAYAGELIPIEPYRPVAPEEARPFDCAPGRLRHPRETKGGGYDLTTDESCSSPGCC